MWPILDADFWRNFWPQFLAGVASLVVGIPVALLIANWSIHQTEEGSQAEELARLESALTAITSAIDANDAELERLGNLDIGHVNYLPSVDAATWDVVKQEIVVLLRDPTLQSRLANHFDALHDLLKINDLYISYSTGLLSTLAGGQAQRGHLHARLTGYAKAISNDAAKLRPLLASARARRPRSKSALGSIPERLRRLKSS